MRYQQYNITYKFTVSTTGNLILTDILTLYLGDFLKYDHLLVYQFWGYQSSQLYSFRHRAWTNCTNRTSIPVAPSAPAG